MEKLKRLQAGEDVEEVEAEVPAQLVLLTGVVEPQVLPVPAAQVHQQPPSRYRLRGPTVTTHQTFHNIINLKSRLKP